MSKLRYLLQYGGILLYCGIVRYLYSNYNICCAYAEIYKRSRQHEKPQDTNATINGVLEQKAIHLDNENMILGYNIKYIMNPDEKCTVDQDDLSTFLLLILVHSSVGNRPQRDAIRNTWGKYLHKYADNHIVLVFLIGSSADQHQIDRIQREGKSFQDLIILDITDSYRNLSLKSVAGLQWTDQFCTGAMFVLKADDDVYVHLPILVKLLNRSAMKNQSSQNKSIVRSSLLRSNKSSRSLNHGLPSITNHGLVGAVITKSRVMRHGLWGLDYNIHPAEFYPDYCSGNLYLMNRTTVHRIVVAAQSTLSDDVDTPASYSGHSSYAKNGPTRIPLVPFEDVLVTGYLAQQVGISCHHHSGFPHWVVGASQRNINRLIRGQLLAVHNVYYENMYQVHNIISSHMKS